MGSGHFAHCYLISGPEGSGKHTLARLLAAGILCQGQGKPCLSCGPCRKVLSGLHPDFITWEDPEHQRIPVKMLREVFRPEVFILPNESEHKIFLIAQELGVEGQNALLKVLEEPPAYAVFILLTDNPEKLLPTVRSRCREIKMLQLDQSTLLSQLERDFPEASREDLRAAASRSGGFLGQARELLQSGARASAQTEGFFRAFLSRDDLELVQVLVPMEKWKRDLFIPEVNLWISLLEEALACRGGGEALNPLARQAAAQRSSADIYSALQGLKKAVTYAQANVSVGAVCGWLEFALRSS